MISPVFVLLIGWAAKFPTARMASSGCARWDGSILPARTSSSSLLRSLGLIERRWDTRGLGCPFVFHKDGHRIGDWRKTWKRACQAARLPGKLFHDLRRTVVRNLVRSGVPERVAM